MSKTILFYRYDSICELSIIRALSALGHKVVEITEEIYNKSITPQQCLSLVSENLEATHIDGVFSINFYPVISEVCNIYKVPYICLTVDCPVFELYSNSIKNKWNRIFLFDYAQYQEFYFKNPECIFYLPLAADTEQYDSVIATMTDSDNRFKSDVSFVGSLYSEKSQYDSITTMPPYIKGYFEGIMSAQLNVYGYNFIPTVITQDIVDEYKKHGPMYQFPEQAEHNEIAVISHLLLGYKMAELERKKLLNTLAKHFNVDLYTKSDTSPLKNVNIKGSAKTFTEMPKIFNLSKINLNFTIKPIQTGLPLRIWDILGCGGFLLTNYQQEIPEYFEIGKELETFGSVEELILKTQYYLEHEDERKAIAKNGYEKVKKMHTWKHRINIIIDTVFR